MKRNIIKQLFYTLLVIIFLTSCSHRVVRTGYDVKELSYKNCNVIIKKNKAPSKNIASKVGSIKLGDNGFSIDCNEEDALNILKNEACALNADLIVITKENRVDLWSSCYRCTADFYTYHDTKEKELITSDAIFDKNKVKERVKKDNKKTVFIAIGSFIVSVLLLVLTL